MRSATNAYSCAAAEEAGPAIATMRRPGPGHIGHPFDFGIRAPDHERMEGTILRRLLLVPVLLLQFGAGVCLAQLDTGAIGGVLTDSSGARIAGAQVVLINDETGATRRAVSNQSGDFTFPMAAAGVYSIQVEHAGFKSYRRAGLRLQVNEQLTIPIALEVGMVSERVVVTAAAPLVESASGALRETVDHERIMELPLDGRNVLQLQALMPGVVETGSLDQGANTPGYSVNGGIGASNNYTLDGGQHLDGYFNAPLPFPNPDAIQEFTIQVNSYSAEFGRNRGAAINAVTKSGTNTWHGGLFEFVRNFRLDARPFFAAATPDFKRNQFGASVGGPIRRNRTFFFYSWQGTHERGTPNTSSCSLLSERMRQGDFSELKKNITDPTTRRPFPGNLIPASQLDPAIVKLAGRYIPLPNSGVVGSTNRNYVAPLPAPADGNQHVVRVDHEVSNRDRLYGRYTGNLDERFNPAGNLPGWGSAQTFHRPGLVLNETHTFSPSLLNSFTATFNRVKADVLPNPSFSMAELGSKAPPGSPNMHGWYAFSISGYFSANTATYWDISRNTFSYEDTLSWYRGRHSLKAGAQISRYQVNQINEYYSGGNWSFGGGTTGDAQSDFMMGIVSSLRQVSNLSNMLRQTLWHFFASDDFKWSQRLTLNLGVRWEPNIGFSERDGKKTSFRPGLQSTVYPGAPPGLLFQGDPQLPPSVARRQWLKLAPRLSFAYTPFANRKTSIRGGYGFFYDTVRTINLNRFPLVQPWVLDVTVSSVKFSDPYPGSSFFPFLPPSTAEARKQFQFVVPGGATVFNSDFGVPYTQQWNLNIQRELPGDMVVTTAYVGSKSTRLFGSHNINPAVWGRGATSGNIQTRRLYPQFTTIEEESTQGYSQYHSFQLTARKKMSRGVTVLATYAVQKNTGLVSPQSEGSLGTRDPFNWNLDRGVQNDDRPQRLSLSYVWNVPAAGRSRAMRAITGGWELTGIVSATAGPGLTVRSGANRSVNGQNLDTADLVGGVYVPGPRSRGEEMERWFNTRAFASPAAGAVGTAGLNILRGPGAFVMDVGLFRNFRIRERVKLQIRPEFFNLLNHTRLGSPNVTQNSVDFGRILATGTPRVGELALKLSF
jgi:hypothetical protein